ncbi:glycosyltransferase family 2 protein [Carboxylicivirga taeanensis]|uniref:glycosyltransferase family 2 protein n=1 Tax=Carboxylicivirga taeanensis TaxID=1416875 RepID=UPI003F6E05A6
MSKISVIIPTYNSADTVENALQSVFKQSYQPFEVIVVNDGSTDSTAQILSKYQAQLKVLHKANGGASSARNEGIRLATGDFIAFLDADDTWHPHHLRYATETLSENPNIHWYTGVIRKSKGSSSKMNYSPKSKEAGLNGNVRNFFYDAFINDGFLVSTTSVVIKTDILRDLKGFKEHLTTGEDRELWLRIALQYPHIGYNISDVNNYNIMPNSLSSVAERRFERRVKALEEMRKETEQSRLDGIEEFMKQEYDRCFRVGIRDGKFRELIEMKEVWQNWNIGKKKFVLNMYCYLGKNGLNGELINKIMAKCYGY